MFFSIPDILPADTLADINKAANALKWRDGKSTAGKQAKSAKNNMQADMNTQKGKVLEKILMRAIQGHQIVRAAARPKRFSRLMLSLSRGHGGYGHHIDNALMGAGENRFRADISFTLFLSSPDEYEGGELEIEMPGMTQSLKPPKGTLVLYPSNTIHRVTPVTSGERMVCVGWIETMIRSAEKREVLLDLENLRAELETKLPNDGLEILYLNKTISNLIRMWAEI